MPTLRNYVASRLVRLYPFYTGVGSLANSSLVRMISGDSNAIAWARIAGGFEVAAPLDDYVGRAVYFGGDLDPKVTWACEQIVRSGDTVLDIGANLGLVTFHLAAMVGPRGFVHAFEPIPRMQELIVAGVERNKVRNVKLHPIALGAEKGELLLSIPNDHAGRASFVPSRAMANAHTIPVPVERLSVVLAKEQVPHLRLVKIDVEGFESEVLDGAKDWFRQDPPDAILFELNGGERRMDDCQCVVQLAHLNYEFFALPKRFLTMKARQVRASDPVPTDAHDFVAIHSSIPRADIISSFRA